MSLDRQVFPKLLYVGDVPVESTVAGSALLYRLLQNYPASNLYIVEANTIVSTPDKRLPEVIYETLNLASTRLLNSRFNSLYSSYLLLTATQKWSQLRKTVKAFQPDAILTVAHGYSWLIAATLAERYTLPLHLIVHDDWVSHISAVFWLKQDIDQQFSTIYRKAQSRLCVSPYMLESYEKRYGVTGTVLYPSRAVDIPVFEQPSVCHKPSLAPLVFAYAGSIYVQGYAQNLVSLSLALETIGSKLLIYSSLSKEAIKQLRLDRPNITVRPTIPSQRLIETLRDEADVLFVPMSFEPEQRVNMEMSFPSKLTDYTAIGLPLLIWGPPYCSVVRWAEENPGVAEVAKEETLSVLLTSIEKLANSSEYRFYLAKNALMKGFQYFSYARGNQQFYQSLIEST